MRVLLPVVLAAVLVSLYVTRLSAPFVFDDADSIVDNPSIRSLSFPSCMNDTRAGSPTAGRPLLNLSFALNYAASGLAPFSYHVVNLALHFACSWLVFVCLALLFAAERSPAVLRRHARGLAAMTSVLFAVHPIGVEIVLYTTQRSEGLVSLCFLLTCYCFLRLASGGGGLGALMLLATAAVLGALSKATIVAVLPLLLLCDRAFYSGSFRAALRTRGRAYLALALSYVPLCVIEAGRPRGDTVHFWDPSYLLLQGRYVLGYLWAVFWPDLAFDYGELRPALVPGAWPYAIALGALVAVCAVLTLVRPRLGYVGAWVFTLLAPTSSVFAIHTEVAADRRMYLPMVAVLAAAVAGLGALFARWIEEPPAAVPRARALLRAGFFVVVVALSLQTVSRAGAFASVSTFWERALLDEPNNPRAAYNLGKTYQSLGKAELAVRAYQVAIYIDSTYVPAYSNLGVLFMKLGRREEGMRMLQRALSLSDQGAVHYNYAIALSQLGDEKQAQAELEIALARDPKHASAHMNLGEMLVAAGKQEAGLAHLARAVALHPDPLTHYNYALALAHAKRAAEARVQLMQALALDPHFTLARTRLATLPEQPGAGERR